MTFTETEITDSPKKNGEATNSNAKQNIENEKTRGYYNYQSCILFVHTLKLIIFKFSYKIQKRI